MKTTLGKITDLVTTPKGVRITIAVWVAILILLSMGPPASDFRVTNFQSLPDDAPSIIAKAKLKEHFPDDQGTPALLVFHAETGKIQIPEVLRIMQTLMETNREHIE